MAKNESNKKKDLEATDELMDAVDKAFDDPFENDSKEEIKEEKKEEVKEETDVINTEIFSKIEDEMEDDMYSFKNDKPTRERDYSYKPQISVPLIILIGTAILCAIATFIATLINKDSSVTQIIMSAILSLFSILYSPRT